MVLLIPMFLFIVSTIWYAGCQSWGVVKSVGGAADGCTL